MEIFSLISGFNNSGKIICNYHIIRKTFGHDRNNYKPSSVAALKVFFLLENAIKVERVLGCEIGKVE